MTSTTNGVTPAHLYQRAGPAPTSGPTNEKIASYLNIGIWGVFALLVIASLPRAYARYRHPSGRSGFRLGAGVPSPATNGRPFVERQASEESEKEKEAYEYIESAPPTPVEGPPPSVGPTHSRVASVAAILHPIHRYLSRPFWFTGYSIGQAIVMTTYTSIIVFGMLYHNLPSFGPRRAGWILVGQLPLVVALGSKNSIIGFLLGVGYEKLNVWHRWVGKTIFLSGLFHVVGYLILFTKKATLVVSIRKQPEGWIAFSGLCLLAVMSLPQIRRSGYTIFWHSHWIGYIMLLVGVSFHVEDAWHYAIAGAGVIVLDQVCRLFKTTFVTATITAIPELQCTRIEVSHLTRGWRAGQHVRLRAVSTLMGPLDLFEPHPFTIATVSESAGGEGLVLYAKKAGDWTTRLYNITGRAERGGEGALGTVGEKSTTMRMVLEGPYGGPGHDVLSSFTSAFVVVGGSGITFGLSTIDEMIREAEAYKAKTKLIHLVWVVQDPSSLLSLLLVLQTFLDRVDRLRTVEVTISVHYTRAIPTALAHTIDTGVNLPRNMLVHPGRPNLPEMLNRFIDKTAGLEKPGGLSGVVVGCCGPESLRDGVSRAERSISGKKRNAVGGVEMVEEMFGW